MLLRDLVYAPSVNRIDADFESCGTRCAAWLFLPDAGSSEERAPIVVMAHGFGGQREMRLPAFAERFASRGLAALVFDYRCFGDSDGEPRNLIDPRRHLADWYAAIEHARSLPRVDGVRLALWGTSFSGGHVLAVGSKTRGISAIVSQVPFVGFDPRSVSMPLRQTARAVFSAFRDLARAALEAFQTLVPPDSSWQNRAPARILFQMNRYRPLRDAAQIEAPVLLIAAEEDSLIPIQAVEAASKQLSSCEYVPLAGTGHFEPYAGDVFERVVELEAEFLCKHLLP